MELTTEKKNGVRFVKATGRLDALTAPDFDRQFSAWIVAGDTAFMFDLSGLEYISSAGLRSMLAAAKQVRNMKGKMSLVGLVANVKEVFKISGFYSILTICESEAEALRAMS